MQSSSNSNNIFKFESFITSRISGKFTKNVKESHIGVINLSLTLFPLQHLFTQTRKHILTLFQHVSQTRITLEQTLIDGDIDTSSLRTFNAIQITYSNNGKQINKTQVILPYKQAKETFNRFSFQVEVSIYLQSDKTWTDSNYFVLTFALQNEKSLKALIECLSVDYSRESETNNLRQQQNDPSIRVKVFPVQSSYPVQEISNTSHPFGPKSYPSFKYQYDQLPKYSAPNIQPDGKLYICHDFKGGYVQDANDFQFSGPLSYRFLNLDKCFIFNYFSHHTISIPTLHWRKLCRKYNVKCLGTFIVQNKDLPAKQYLTQEYCQFLIFIARKLQFDGYLINIEFQIQQEQVKQLISWLGRLTKGIHQAIPNSNIVWYDSIKQDGKIAYQNSLNWNSIPFVQQVDYFFSNYWWNQQKMKETVNQMKKNPSLKSKVFIGNDCFGRNTYGGGQFDIWKAANKLNEINQVNTQEQLKVALFAPGFTYQGQAQMNRQLWLFNEKRMYNGVQSKVVKIDRWSQVVNGGNGWKQEGNWSVSSYQWCQRMFELSLNSYFQMANNQGQLTIKFKVSIKGTPPNTRDLYKIVLQLYEKEHNFVMNQTKPLDFNNPDFASEKQCTIIEQICIPIDMITPGLCFRVYQMGKDSQNWAGHFGTQFSNQTLYLSIDSQNRNWIKRQRIRSLQSIPYHSFCNMGHGDSFFHEGQKISQLQCNKQKGYGFLCDMDIPMTKLLNDNGKIDISYDDGYMGGTCLRIKDSKWKLLNLILNEKLDSVEGEGRPIKIRLVMKYLKNKEITIKSNKQVSKLQMRELKSSWRQYIAVLKVQTRSLQTIQVDASAAFQNYCLLGQLQITALKEDEVRSQSDVIQSIVSISPEFVQLDPNFVIDMAIQFSQSFANSSTKYSTQYLLFIAEKNTNRTISCCFITSLVDNTFIFRNAQVGAQNKQVFVCIQKRCSGKTEVFYKKLVNLKQVLCKKMILIK